MKLIESQLRQIVREELNEAKKPNFKQIANEVRTRALRYVASSLKKFQNEPDMIKMFCSDLKDHYLLAMKIEVGDLKGANRFARNMDTASREQMPRSAWNLVMDEETIYVDSRPKPPKFEGPGKRPKAPPFED